MLRRENYGQDSLQNRETACVAHCAANARFHHPLLYFHEIQQPSRQHSRETNHQSTDHRHTAASMPQAQPELRKVCRKYNASSPTRPLTRDQYMEKRLFVQLNGNRKVIGVLRGYDVRTSTIVLL